MTTTKTPQTPAEFAAMLDRRITELEMFAAGIPDNVTQPWVVVNTVGFPLKFDIDGAGWIKGVKTARVETATRFTRAQAEHLQNKTHDGKGDPGRAVMLRQAALDQARQSAEVVAHMQSLKTE